VPSVFGEIQRRGGVTDDEMLRVFNLGVGMVAVVPADVVDRALEVVRDAALVGAIEPGSGNVRIL
jgi:phosphoribosylformylglycinamidine cyclo-ligase